MSDALLEILRSGWDIHPTLLAPIGLLALVYGLTVGYGVASRGRRFPAGQVIAFALGIATLLLALHSPLHHLADDYLFSAHMVQHLVLTLVVPPLLLLGTPDWVIRPVLDRPLVRRAARSPLYPVVAFAIFNIPFAFIHFPALYDGLFGTEASHRATHVALLVTAAITWLPLVSPLPDVIPRLSAPARMLYCFVQTLPGALVGALLTFVDWVIYRHYGAKPMLLGVSPIADQQVGGLLMWVVGGTFYLVILTVIFFIWADREERTAYAGGGRVAGIESRAHPSGSLVHSSQDGADGQPQSS
jgi:putative membrane protein